MHPLHAIRRGPVEADSAVTLLATLGSGTPRGATLPSPLTDLSARPHGQRPPAPETAGPRQPVLMMGKGWFPSETGGLERYYRDLLERLPEARGVVVGPAADAPARVLSASRHDAALLRRLLSFWRASERMVTPDAVIDAHFALYAALPLLATSERPPIPAVLLITKRPVVFAADLKRPCRRAFAKTTGSFILSRKCRSALRTLSGITRLYAFASGLIKW